MISASVKSYWERWWVKNFFLSAKVLFLLLFLTKPDFSPISNHLKAMADPCCSHRQLMLCCCRPLWFPLAVHAVLLQGPVVPTGRARCIAAGPCGSHWLCTLAVLLQAPVVAAGHSYTHCVGAGGGATASAELLEQTRLLRYLLKQQSK